MIVFLYFNEDEDKKNILRKKLNKIFWRKIFLHFEGSFMNCNLDQDSIEHFVYSFNPFSGVSAEYGNNELFFVYKNFIGNNRSSPFGVYESRRSVGGTDLKRSPISSEIHK